MYNILYLSPAGGLVLGHRLQSSPFSTVLLLKTKHGKDAICDKDTLCVQSVVPSHLYVLAEQLRKKERHVFGEENVEKVKRSYLQRSIASKGSQQMRMWMDL